MKLKQIGVIHSPYKSMNDVPKSTLVGKESVCEIEIFHEYQEGLLDIEQASHLIVLYWLDKADRTRLKGRPPHDTAEHGVFATRSPHRPNPIGFSVVSLIERRDNVLKISDITALDNTPVIDIKPYIGKVDLVKDSTLLWLDKRNESK